MTLIKLIVTDSYGRTIIPPTEKGKSIVSLIGNHEYVYKDDAKSQKDPYRFWAAEAPDQAKPAVHQIVMVMPLGGAMSGLYRFPRVGEEVLAAAVQESEGDTTEYYMMGYVPSAANPFNVAMGSYEGSERIFEEEGEILRYYNAGYGDSAYSELGFYKAEKAQWPMTKGGEDFPPIDVLVLDSAGNIRETAQNHHLQMAKRIEILADTPEVIDRSTNAVDAQGTLPIGEYLGDDASLHGGDIHIRAGNRVIIKADQEIRLQVGRSIFRLDDTGINITTKNVTGNYVNSYDTTLDMNPRNGITMTGKNITLNAGYRFNAGDGMGGSVATTMGNLNLGGREVSIDSYNNTEYMFTVLYQALEYMVNAASGGMALGKADIKIADYIKFSQDNLEALSKMARKVYKLWAKRKEVRKQRKDEREREEALRKKLQEEETAKQRRDFLMREMGIDPKEMLDAEAFEGTYGPEVAAALHAYSTQAGFMIMNRYLRGLSGDEPLDPEYAAHLEALNMFFKNKTVKEEATVYRYFTPYAGWAGGKITDYGDPGKTNPDGDLDGLVGTIVSDAGFTSTATVDQPGGSFALQGTCKLTLRIPAGSPAGVGMAGVSFFKTESEYLLPPGSSYRIDSVFQNRTTHKLEIVATLVVAQD
jgi:hypothetical protein